MIKSGRRFRYGAYWEFISGFGEVVESAWAVPTGKACPLKAINLKLEGQEGTASLEQKPHRRYIQKQLMLVNEIILQLDTAQDFGR